MMRKKFQYEVLAGDERLIEKFIGTAFCTTDRQAATTHSTNSPSLPSTYESDKYPELARTPARVPDGTMGRR
jgi:hypothetical protein